MDTSVRLLLDTVAGWKHNISAVLKVYSSNKEFQWILHKERQSDAIYIPSVREIP